MVPGDWPMDDIEKGFDQLLDMVVHLDGSTTKERQLDYNWMVWW